MMIPTVVFPFSSKHRPPRLCASSTAVLTGVLLFSSGVAQRVSPGPSEPSVRIEQGLRMIQEGKQTGLPAAQLGYLWATLAGSYQDAADAEKALGAYEHALQLLATDSEAKAIYATALDNMGSLYLEYGRIAEAEKLRKRALAIRHEIGSPLEIGWSEQHMAEIALVKHRFKDAESWSRSAFETLSRSGHDVSSEVASLAILTYAECMQSRPEEGLREAERAMRLAENGLAAGSVERANVSMTLGFAQWKTGSTAEAERSMQDGLRILRVQLGNTNPILRAAMYQYRDFLKAMHRGPEVKVIEEQISAMMPQAARRSCAGCTVSVYVLR
jgi:tetratricopeptide (TPR) repeat protein